MSLEDISVVVLVASFIGVVAAVVIESPALVLLSAVAGLIAALLDLLSGAIVDN